MYVHFFCLESTKKFYWSTGMLIYLHTRSPVCTKCWAIRVPRPSSVHSAVSTATTWFAMVPQLQNVSGSPELGAQREGPRSCLSTCSPVPLFPATTDLGSPWFTIHQAAIGVWGQGERPRDQLFHPALHSHPTATHLSMASVLWLQHGSGSLET